MLKSLLTLLLSKFVKRSETAFISNQALPAYGKTGAWIKVADLSVNVDNATYVAPADGYAHMNTGNFCTFAFLTTDSDVGVTAGAINGDVPVHWSHIVLPVNKGQTLTYSWKATAAHNQDGGLVFMKTNGGS